MSKYKQGGILAIVYDVWISGTKLGMSKKACINSIQIKETVEGSDVATIQITDPEFLYIEDNIFLEDNTIKIRLGWDNTTSSINITFRSRNTLITGVDRRTTNFNLFRLFVNLRTKTDYFMWVLLISQGHLRSL